MISLVWNTTIPSHRFKENIDENLKTEEIFDFDSVKSISSEAVLASRGWPKSFQLSVGCYS